jgi:hypothetical protein
MTKADKFISAFFIKIIIIFFFISKKFGYFIKLYYICIIISKGPEEYCLKQIDISNQKKKAIIEMIKKYE